MMSLAKQVYDYYFRPYLGEKGQDMVEYALMLAIIVGIGWLIYQQAGRKIALTMYSPMLAASWIRRHRRQATLLLVLLASLLALLPNGSLGKCKELLRRQEFFGKAVNHRLAVFPKNGWKIRKERRNHHEKTGRTGYH